MVVLQSGESEGGDGVSVGSDDPVNSVDWVVVSRVEGLGSGSNKTDTGMGW